MNLDKTDLPLDNFKPNVQLYAIKSHSIEYELIGHGLLAMIGDFNDQNGTQTFIQVEGNLTHEILVRSQVRNQNNYEKQKGSVIVWGDDQLNIYRQLAISFERDSECDFFWYVHAAIVRRLICEKIGKNYLNISGRDSLNMPTQDNLSYVLDRTINAQDMIQYHMLNSNEFILSLHKVFLVIQEQADRNGVGMVGRILSSILSSVDHKLVQVLFKDPIFDIILDIQKSILNIDFPQLWRDTVKVKPFTSLNQEVNVRVQIYHRVRFYRQQILDYFKQLYLQHVLLMTHYQCCKDIIVHLTKDNTIDDLLQIKYAPAQVSLIENQQCEEETYSPEVEAIRRKQIAEKQLQFLMEAFVICKQVQTETTRSKFLDKIYRTNLIDTITEYMYLNIVKSMDLLACIAQAAPLRFVQFLKNNYSQQPQTGIYVKLVKKYYFSGEEFQLAIIQILKYLNQALIGKDNLDFFISTFIAYNFQSFRQEKGLLILVSQIMQLSSNLTAILQHAIRNNVFMKLANFARNMRQDKISELRIAKIIKVILKANTSNGTLQSSFLSQVNRQIVQSGFFQCSMKILQRNIRFNNVISSSLLQNLKTIKQFTKITAYHSYLQFCYCNKPCLQKYLQPIISFKQSKINDQSQKMQEELDSTDITAKLKSQYHANFLKVQGVSQIYKRIRENSVEADQFANLQCLTKKIKKDRELAPNTKMNIELCQNSQGNQ